MKLFIFDHPVPFPSSEYGGMWVIAAEDGAQAAKLALQIDTYYLPDYTDRLHRAIAAGKVLEIADTEPRVVEYFIT